MLRGSRAPPPGPRGLADVLATLPPDTAAALLHEAGPHTRLVCRAFCALQPVESLILGRHKTAAELQATIARLPPSITSLDLSGTPCPSLRHAIADLMSVFLGGSNKNDKPTGPVTPATLAAVAAANLPALQQLALPPVQKEHTPAVLGVLQACSQLHTLQAEFASNSGNRAVWTPLMCPPVSTRIRSLASLPTRALARLCSARARALPQLTHLELGPHAVKLPGGTAWGKLAAAAPNLRSLQLCTHDPAARSMEAVTQLPRFTALTHLFFINDLATGTSPQLLQGLGSLTTLRSLWLATVHAPKEAGWLLRLTHLTCLAITVTFADPGWHGGDGAAQHAQEVSPVVCEVASNAARLPALRRLALTFTDDYDEGHFPAAWLGLHEPPSFFQALAAATQLQHLSLFNLPLPPSHAGTLSSLQCLTALQLADCPVTDPTTQDAAGGPPTLGWVSSLTALEQVGCITSNRCRSSATPVSLPWPALAHLPRLHTLMAMEMHAALTEPLVQLLVAVGPRLQRLSLTCGKRAEGPWDLPPRVLESMTRLRVLDLGTFACDTQQLEELLLQHWGLPTSLRQCYLPDTEPYEGGYNPSRLQAAYPHVAFRLYSRRDRRQW